MTKHRTIHRLIIAIVAGFAITGIAVRAQAPLMSDDSKTSLGKVPAVQFLYPEQVTLPAGKAQVVALHFRIAHGLHINSHKPKEKFLIPTDLSVPESSGVRLADAAYPEGTDFALPVDPKTVLSVYTGEFTIQARLTASAGDHLVEAKLRFQACDENACMPPKTITVAIDVIGR